MDLEGMRERAERAGGAISEYSPDYSQEAAEFLWDDVPALLDEVARLRRLLAWALTYAGFVSGAEAKLYDEAAAAVKDPAG